MWNEEWIIYKALIGSRAYGLARPDSDIDVRGIFLPPASLTWGLSKPNDTHEDLKNGNDIVFYELEKFIRLVLSCNPNILEVLWSPEVQYTTHLMDELIAMRGALLSKKLIPTYLGYAQAQFVKMKNHPEWPWKHAMHLIRLLIAGKHALDTGEVLVRLEDGDVMGSLQEIKAGEWTLDGVIRYKDLWEEDFKASAARSKLQDEPDYVAANAFLLKARRQAVDF